MPAKGSIALKNSTKNTWWRLSRHVISVGTIFQKQSSEYRGSGKSISKISAQFSSHGVFQHNRSEVDILQIEPGVAPSLQRASDHRTFPVVDGGPQRSIVLSIKI